MASDPSGNAIWRGHVLTPSGEPVGGAQILDLPSGTTTESRSDGSFELQLAEGKSELEASAEDHFRFSTFEATVVAGEVLESVLLQLAPMRTVSGRAVNSQGEPVVGAYLFLTFPDSDENVVWAPMSMEVNAGETRTDDDGSFEFEGAPDVPLRVSANHSLHMWFETSVGTGDAFVELRFGLPHLPIDVRGRVVDPSGNPIEGARLRLEHPARMPQTHSAADGRFFLDTMLPQDPSYEFEHEVHILVAAEGFATRRFDPAPFERSNELELELQPELTISGLVLDADGTPCANAGLRLSSPREAWSGMDWLSWADNRYHETDEEGSFSVGGLWDDVFRVRVTAPGRTGFASFEARGGQRNITVQVGEGAEHLVRIRTHVLDDATGEPIERYQVYVRNERGGSGSTHDAPDGWFDAMPLDPGRYAVRVGLDGYVKQHLAMDEYQGGLHEHRFRLRRAGSLRLRIVDAAGNPVGGIGVLPVDEADLPIAFDNFDPYSASVVPPKTGPDGRCWLDEVPAGVLRVRLSAPDGAGMRFEHFEVSGSPLERELVW